MKAPHPVRAARDHGHRVHDPLRERSGAEERDILYFAVVSRDGQRVSITQGHRVIGRIEGEGAKHLSKGLSEPGDPGVVPILIKDYSSLSGCGKAVIVKDR